MKRETAAELCVFVLLVGMGVAWRLISNEYQLWNFASVTGTALFAGYYLHHRIAALLVPLLIMGISNIWLPEYDVPGTHWWTHLAMPAVVYGAYLMPVLLRGVLRKRLTLVRLGLSAVGCSLLFFAVTNFAHWALVAHLEGKTLLGCYIEAIPFYRGTLAGDLCWTAVLFGSYALAVRYEFLPAVNEKRATVTA